MKNVLLPTDLSVQSLWPAKKLLQEFTGEEPLNIYVTHMVEIPTSIGDLLMLGRSNKFQHLPAVFKDAFQILQNKSVGTKIHIHFELLYGHSSRILKNFMEGAAIEQVYLLKNYNYSFNQKDAVDFTPYFSKIKLPVSYIPFKMEAYSDFQILSILLNNEEQEEKQNTKEYAIRQSVAV